MLSNAQIDRLNSRFVPEPNSGCWLWDGAVSHDGYPYLKLTNKTLYAHRALYELRCEPIPEGLTLDHLCRVRSCVNPAHMQPVTLRENIARGDYGWRGRLTHCKHGHEFTPENTIARKGRNGGPARGCRECGRIAQRNYVSKKRS